MRSLRFPVHWDGAALLRVRSPVQQTLRTGAPCPFTCSARLSSSAPYPSPCLPTRRSSAPCLFTCSTDVPQRCSVSVEQFTEAPHCCSRPIELSNAAPLRRLEPSHPSHEQGVATRPCRSGLYPPIPLPTYPWLILANFLLPKSLHLFFTRASQSSSPVSDRLAATGFDSGEPRWRKKMERMTIEPMARNSLCQFWKDSNQNRVVCR